MLAFQITVQLDQALDCDCTIFNTMMLKHGFFRSVRTADGSWYHLPPMEYSHYSAFDLSPIIVRERVVKIAAKTGKAYRVMVSKHNAVTDAVHGPLPDRAIGTL
jgi:hypothetical protein